jgi:hypothetical protein
MKAWPFTNLHKKFFLVQGFQNSIFLLYTWLGSDTLWVGLGLSVGMCGLHNVCCCCAGKSNRDTCLLAYFGRQGSGKPVPKALPNFKIRADLGIFDKTCRGNFLFSTHQN